MFGASFDRVVRTLPTGEEHVLSKKEFEELALSERVKAILGKQLKFYRGKDEIPVKEALGER